MVMNVFQKICLGFYILLVIFWLTILSSGTTDAFNNYFYSFLFGLIPLAGGIVAIWQSKLWGGLKSAVGKGVFFIGLGIFAWGCGEMIWSYYNFFLNIPAPYPSLADIGFAPSIFFYGLGTIFLAKATGAKYGLRHKNAKLYVTITALILTALSYYLLVVVARGGVIVPEGESGLKTILDIAYPLGDFLALMIAVIISGLSFKYLGGNYKLDIFSIWAGLAVMFIADAIFSYTTTVGTYYNGNFGDLMLTTGLFLITFGVLGFARVKNH